MSPLLVSALGPKWADTADALRILAVIMMVCPVSNFLGPLLQAVSKPHSLAVIEWAHAIISAGSLVVAGEVLKHSSTWGQVTGMAVTRILTTAMLMAPLVFWLLPKYVGLRPSGSCENHDAQPVCRRGNRTGRLLGLFVYRVAHSAPVAFHCDGDTGGWLGWVGHSSFPRSQFAKDRYSVLDSNVEGSTLRLLCRVLTVYMDTWKSPPEAAYESTR